MKGRPFRKGFDGRRGHGLKGIAGRKPFAFKAFMRELAHDPEAQDQLRVALRNPETPGYAALWKMVAAYAAGLPVQTVRLGGLLSVAQRVEGLSDSELERYLSAGTEALLELVTTADEDEEQAV